MSDVSNITSYVYDGETIHIDTGFESSLGLYGSDFWTSVQESIYEESTLNFIRGLTRDGYKCFIDVGAATGCMTLLAAIHGLKVIAVEPQESVYRALVRNIELNEKLKSQIETEFALVGPQKKVQTSQIFTPGAVGPLLQSKIANNFLSLIDLIERFTEKESISIKIDIEGAEFPLFQERSTLEFLCKRKPLIYLALHPGFRKPLRQEDGFVKQVVWKLYALIDVLLFYKSVQNYAEICIPSDSKRLKLKGLLYSLWRDNKEFVLRFP